MCADVNQRPRTNIITTMAAAGGNCPLAPHMRPFVPCRCVGLIEEDPPSKPICFLLGLRGSMTQRDYCSAMREVAKRETAAQRDWCSERGDDATTNRWRERGAMIKALARQ